MDMIFNPTTAFADALLPFACRRVSLPALHSLADNPLLPAAGDLALAEVLSPGANQHLVLADGRSQRLVRGQSLLVTLGSPYAPLAHTGRLPSELGECDLLTAHGVAGIEIARAQRLAAPTRLRLYGLVGDARGQRLNLSDFALPQRPAARPARSLLVVSTARRTQASSALLQLVHGLAQHGGHVATLQITGEMDADLSLRLRHAGAGSTLDAADAGLSATGGVSGEALLAAADRLLAEASAQGAAVAITRLAGGMAQREVRALLATPGFASRFDGVVLTAADALSARAGVAALQAAGLNTLAVTGALCASPLAMREAAPLPCPLLSPAELGELAAQGGLDARPSVQAMARAA